MSCLGHLIGGFLSYWALRSGWRELRLLRYRRKRDQCVHIVILWKVLVASLCNHTSEVWYCAWSAQHGWVQSSLELLRELWWKCTTSAECKTDISAVLTVKSGLDPHMINLTWRWILIIFWLFLVALLSTNHKCTHPCLLLLRRKDVWSLLKMMLSSRRTQPPVDCLWSLKPSFPG